MATLYQIAHNPPDSLEESVPADARRIVARALTKNVAERYQSAEEMLRELQASLAGVPLDSETETLTVGTGALGKDLGTGPPPGRWLTRRRGAGVIAIAALAAAGIFAGPRIARTILPAGWFAPAAQHLAVLPFRNIGNDPSDAALCDGLEEILSSRLADAHNSRNPVVMIPAREVRRRNITSAADAWRQLRANLVVEGTVIRSAQGLQLTLNLVDAEKLSTLDSTVLKDSAGDFSALEDRATQRVAGFLSVRTGASSGSNTTPSAYESYVKATGYLARYDKPENLDKAIEEYGSAINSDPRFELAYAGLGEASRLKYRISHDPKWLQSAIDNSKQAIALNSQLAPAYITLGQVHDGAGEKDLAIQEFNTALRLDPVNADATLALASAYEHAGRPRDAEQLYKKAIDLRPEYWDGYSRLALFYTRAGRYGEAEAQYRKAIQYAPDNAILYGNFGVLLYNMQKRGQARSMYQKSIALRPSYASYSNLGELDLEDGRYADAAQYFEKALKLNDRDYHVWSNLAGAYEGSSGWDAKARGTLQHAADLAETVREARPKDAGTLADLATYHAKLGQKEIARQRLRQALALAPDDVDVLFWTAEAYEEMGDREGALAGLRSAFAKGLAADRVERDPEFDKLRSDPRYAGLPRTRAQKSDR